MITIRTDDVVFGLEKVLMTNWDVDERAWRLWFRHCEA